MKYLCRFIGHNWHSMGWESVYPRFYCSRCVKIVIGKKQWDEFQAPVKG